MKIVLFSTHISWPPAYETELEIIQRHLDAGDKVIQLVCNAHLATCDINLHHDLRACISCVGKRLFGRSLLSEKIPERSFLQLTKENKREMVSIQTTFDNVTELKSYRVEDFDIGYAVAASLISKLRDPDPDLSLHADILKKYLLSSLAVYRSIQNFLKTKEVDSFYIFNGRFAHTRAAWRACQSKQIKAVLHDRGNNIYYYQLFKDFLIHDIAAREGEIRETWANTEKIRDREKVAARYYIGRSEAKERGGSSFVKTQVHGLLPEEWDEQKHNIVIFTSSEDEYSSIDGSWKNPLYDSQLDGLKRIFDDLEAERTRFENIHCYVRIHPNLSRVENSSVADLCKLRKDKVSIIKPDSPISSYTLLKAADKVITFGSTMGIEAVFWGKPSILAGMCFYRNLGGTHNAKSHKHLVDLLGENLPPKSRKAALMYGYWLMTFGIRYKYYEPKDFVSGKFKNISIQENENLNLRLRILASFLRRRRLKRVIRRIHRELLGPQLAT